MENGAQKTQLFGSRFLFCCLMFGWSMDTACASVGGLLDTITFPHFSSKYFLSHRQNASRLCHTVTENVPVAWDHNKTMTISYSFTIHLTWILDTPACLQHFVMVALGEQGKSFQSRQGPSFILWMTVSSDGLQHCGAVQAAKMLLFS